MKNQKMPQKKRWSVKCILICAFIIIACGAVTHDSPVKDLKPEKVSSSESIFTSVRYEWPTIPFEPVKYGTKPTNVPVLHRVEITPGVVKSLPDAVMQEKLKVLIRQNVVSEVAKEMDALMRLHKITFALAEMEADAAFDVYNGQPRILLNIDRLASLDGVDDTLRYMIVISHEFVHYKQWARATQPSERATFATGFVPSIGDCLLAWSNEREAYYNMCLNGNAVGIAWVRSHDPKVDICARVNTNEAFDQAFYYLLASSTNEILKNTCDDIWWNLAGGPHS